MRNFFTLNQSDDSSYLDISIDGDTACAFTENVEQRFLSYGWQVLHVDDGDRSVGSSQLLSQPNLVS